MYSFDGVQGQKVSQTFFWYLIREIIKVLFYTLIMLIACICTQIMYLEE